ncbi:MAG TPA: CAP domain-containing protein [Phycisphaerae bacterium]|nr:CAP domain-containing protein [Phycisphaerae bacterium]HNU46960.1 CAP domain-containing protein [Phycisphaerae bacterium]
MRLTRLNVVLAVATVPFLAGGCYEPLGAPDEKPDGSVARLAAEVACSVPDGADRLADQVLQLINLERASDVSGLAPVVASPVLAEIAAGHACRMISGSFLAHIDPESGYGCGERAVRSGYAYFRVGENLAAGHRTPAEVVKAWMDSPEHRDILLDPAWKEVGIAVRAGGEYGMYWVLELGDPARLAQGH